MPSHVKIFFWLTVAVVAWSVLSLVWSLVFPDPVLTTDLAKLPADIRDKVQSSSLTLGVIAIVFWSVVRLLLAWLAAWRRQNWARWTYAAFLAIQTALPFAVAIAYHRVGTSSFLAYRWAHPLVWLPTILLAAAVFFVFTGNARDWFRPTMPSAA